MHMYVPVGGLGLVSVDDEGQGEGHDDGDDEVLCGNEVVWAVPF